MPAGLSTSSSPSTSELSALERSVVFSSPRYRSVLLLDVGEERLDSRCARDGIVFLELNLRCDTQLELARHARAEMRCHTVEAIEGSLLLGIASQDAHVNSGVPKIGADLRTGDGNEPDYPGILCRFSEEGSYLDADRFGDAVRSTRVTQKRPPPKSASGRLAPSGSTRARHQL